MPLNDQIRGSNYLWLRARSARLLYLRRVLRSIYREFPGEEERIQEVFENVKKEFENKRKKSKHKDADSEGDLDEKPNKGQDALNDGGVAVQGKALEGEDTEN